MKLGRLWEPDSLSGGGHGRSHTGSSMAASVLLLGDSNLSYTHGGGRWASLLPYLRHRQVFSVAEQVCEGEGCFVFFPLQQLRLGSRERLALRTLIRHLPSPTWAFIHAGQNDADHWSRMSTRTHELAGAFRDHLRSTLERLETGLCDLGIQRVLWATPFDDPEGGFTREYQVCVSILDDCIRTRLHWSYAPLPCDFEEDRYHLNPQGRRRYAQSMHAALRGGMVWEGNVHSLSLSSRLVRGFRRVFSFLPIPTRCLIGIERIGNLSSLACQRRGTNGASASRGCLARADVAGH